MMPKSDRVTTVSAHRHIRRDRSVVAFIKDSVRCCVEILIANKPKCTAMYVGTITAEMFRVIAVVPQGQICSLVRVCVQEYKGTTTIASTINHKTNTEKRKLIPSEQSSEVQE